VKLAPALYLAAAILSLKAVWDLIPQTGSFPAWFVPAFAAGIGVLLVVAGATTIGIWKAREVQPARGRIAAAVWVLLPLSFVCTSAVHQLYPFRPSLPAAWASVGPVLRFNLVVAAAGFLVSVGLALAYRAGHRRAAVTGLAVLGLLLLVPNDDCANPFNVWWLAVVGASPLMFVPNLYAALFGIGALLGVRPRFHLLALAVTCVATALLGVGHSLGVIW
jgi:hypothetical protein